MNNTTTKTSMIFRQEARESLQGNWIFAVLLTLIYLIIVGLPGYLDRYGNLISIIVSGPLMLGFAACFLKLVRGEKLVFEELFYGFKKFTPAFILYLLEMIFIFLWSLLFLIPGIIAAYRYSMAFFILNDHPEMSGSEALEASKKMMDGNKGKLFSLHLSFIGWFFLSILTFGIGMLWLIPYVETATTHFYQDLKGNQPNEWL